METDDKVIWHLDRDHSEISFKVRHLMISLVTGRFHDVDATIAEVQEHFIDAEVQFTARVDSIDTNSHNRDAHLKSNDFFNAAEYPEIRFRSKYFDGRVMVGELTIRDVTKEISLGVAYNGMAVDSMGRTRAGFEVLGAINRKDFKLAWSTVTETGGIVVGDTVQLVAYLQFIRT